MSEPSTLIEENDTSPHPPEPQKTAAPSAEKPLTTSDADAGEGKSNYFAVLFRDGLDMPIDGLTFIATYPSGFMCTAESTAAGAIALPVTDQDKGEVKIEVKDSTGKTQSVCSIDPSKCDGPVIVRSPKTKAKVAMQPHQQVAPARPPAQAASAPSKGKEAEKKKQTEKPKDTPQKIDQSQGWWGANGSLGKAWAWLSSRHIFGTSQTSAGTAKSPAQGLSSAGQPVAAIVGPEADNKDNLRLGRNNVYRQQILDASKRLGLIPQALCALMDCEAGKVTETVPVVNPDGTTAKDKKGRPLTKKVRELWNANAGNAESGAAGLTQFLASTWLTHVLIPGYYIHEKSVANGWVKQVSDAKGRKQWMFVLADGTTNTKPYAKRQSDVNVKKCLAMRMDPAWSINAAADYGNTNLKVLERAGFKLSGLSDMDRAKLMYLLHHEGEGAGPMFLKNSLATGRGGAAALRRKFVMQLGRNGEAKVDEHVKAAKGDVEFAYRRWLSKYIDNNFRQATKYFFKNPVSPKDLSDLAEMIGGEAVE
jgi:hypothetical protein